MFHTADQILRFVLEVLIGGCLTSSSLLAFRARKKRGKVRFHVNKYTNER